MKKLELAYLAGIFDGEGCIQIARQKPQAQGWSTVNILRCQVGMANEYIPRLFQFHFGGSIRYQKPRAEKWQQQWYWCIRSYQALEFLKIILPYLRLKKAEAELGIKFQSEKKWVGGRNKKSAESLAVEEAQAILMSKLKRKS